MNFGVVDVRLDGCSHSAGTTGYNGIISNRLSNPGELEGRDSWSCKAKDIEVHLLEAAGSFEG